MRDHDEPRRSLEEQLPGAIRSKAKQRKEQDQVAAVKDEVKPAETRTRQLVGPECDPGVAEQIGTDQDRNPREHPGKRFVSTDAHEGDDTHCNEPDPRDRPIEPK